jgi:hypothetical protein
MDTPTELLPYIDIYGKQTIKDLLNPIFNLCKLYYYGIEDETSTDAERAIAIKYLNTASANLHMVRPMEVAVNTLSLEIIPKLTKIFLDKFYEEEIISRIKILQSIDDYKLVILCPEQR